MKLIKEQGFASVIIIGAIVTTFVAGTGTVVASNSSKPGDSLYSIDRGAERVQLAFALTEGSKKDLHATLASERLVELEALLAEDELDESGISDARSNFEDHRAKLADLSDNDGNIDEHELELELEIEDKKSSIDKIAETEQKSLETQREDLKKQYEQALKDGDTAKAATLMAQIESFEGQLKAVEVQRELQKQETEEQSESEKKEAEQEKKAAEEQAEAEKKEEER